MKGDDGEPGAGAEQARRGREKCVEVLELTVHPDTQRLKRSRRRIDTLVALARDGPPDDVRELPRRGDGSGTPGFDDGPGDTAGKTLLAVAEDHVREILFLDVRQPFGGCVPGGLIHPHVER